MSSKTGTLVKSSSTLKSEQHLSSLKEFETKNIISPKIISHCYRDIYGNKVSLVETRHGYKSNNNSKDAFVRNGAIEYVLNQKTRRGFTVVDLGLLCLGIILWTITRSYVCAALSLLGFGLTFRSSLFTDKTS